MSAITHSDQVFLGLPLLLALEIVILVMEFMHKEERATCPYHLKRLVRRAAVTSCTPNIAQSVSADISSSSLTARFDENPAMTLGVIKETKHYGRTHTRTDRQRENSIPPTNKVCGGYKNKVCGGYKNKVCGGYNYRLMKVKSIAECSKGSILQYF